MIQKKICMIGAFAVGKTSLVERFVTSLFSEKYHTTIGVKIDKKLIHVRDCDMSMILWDLYGEDEFQKIRASYLRGAAGYLLVADGTRAETLTKAVALQKFTEETLGKTPFALLINKCDLVNEREIDRNDLETCRQNGWRVIETSAKTGEAIEDAFLTLAADMLECDANTQ